MAIDTLKVAKRLREAGFTEPQAEAVIAAVQEGTEGAELATRPDITGLGRELRAEIAHFRSEFKAEIADVRTEIADVRTELKAEIADLRAELKAEIADLRSELRQVELRLEAKIEAMKADILTRIFRLILGTLVVNIVAIVGAMFAVAKLIGR